MLRLYYRPQNIKENIGRKDLKYFIASMKVFLGIWSILMENVFQILIGILKCWLNL